jgi:hypothetical protein
MILPKISKNNQEMVGVLEIAVILARMGIIFRPTSNTDVGIDAQIEYVLEGQATGRLAAVQIKSGKSYLRDKGNHFAFYPEDKHKAYWENFPLPVMLMLHDPDTNNVYFSDARYYLSIPKSPRNYNYIPVFKKNEITKVPKEELFGLPQRSRPNLLPVDEILKELVMIISDEDLFPINYFDLFVNGLTNLCRQSFFSMSLAVDIANFNLDILGNSKLGLRIGFNEYEFLHNYVGYVYSQGLIKIDYTDYMIDWKERQLVPEFLAPLTQKGYDLVSHIYQVEREIFGKNDPSVACERYLSMVYAPSDIERLCNIFEFSRRYFNNVSNVPLL